MSNVIPAVITDQPITADTSTTISGVLVGASGKIRAANVEDFRPFVHTILLDLGLVDFPAMFAADDWSLVQ